MSAPSLLGPSVRGGLAIILKISCWLCAMALLLVGRQSISPSGTYPARMRGAEAIDGATEYACVGGNCAFVRAGSVEWTSSDGRQGMRYLPAEGDYEAVLPVRIRYWYLLMIGGLLVGALGLRLPTRFGAPHLPPIRVGLEGITVRDEPTIAWGSITRAWIRPGKGRGSLEIDHYVLPPDGSPGLVQRTTRLNDAFDAPLSAVLREIERGFVTVNRRPLRPGAEHYDLLMQPSPGPARPRYLLQHATLRDAVFAEDPRLMQALGDPSVAFPYEHFLREGGTAPLEWCHSGRGGDRDSDGGPRM
jgi:hypothetical protein